MCLVRNSSPYPVKLASYQIDNTKFGKDGGVIYPGECRYVKAEEFQWDTCMIYVFTKGGHVPGKMNIDIGLNVSVIGFNIHVNSSVAMAGVVIGKHSFFEFKEEGTTPVFVENESLNQQTGCRVCHGY